MSETTAIVVPEEYRDASRVNLLMPATEMELAPYHTVSFRSVKISTNPKDGDVYEQKKGEWALTKRGLNRLVAAAGGIWLPTQLSRDDEGRVTAHAMLRLRSPDGQEQIWPGTYTWDTPARIAEAEARMNKEIARGKVPNWFNGNLEAYHAYLREKFEDQRHQLILHATSRAETGAMNRAIRNALGLKTTYTPQELARPFVVMCVSIDVYAMPLTQQILASTLIAQQLGGLVPPLPQLENPNLPMMRPPQEPYVDPVSDAVAAGEVEPSDEFPIKTGKPYSTIIEDMAVPQNDHSSDSNSEPTPSSEHDSKLPALKAEKPKGWPPRPWEVETLRKYMQIRAGTSQKKPDQKLFQTYHAAVGNLVRGEGLDGEEARKNMEAFLFGVESSRELTAGQCSTVIRWINAEKDPDTGEWVPNPVALEEFRRVLRAHEKEAGQLDFFDEPVPEK